MTVMCKSHADHMYTTHFFDKTRVVTLDEESEDLIAGREAGGPLLFHGFKVSVRETGHISVEASHCSPTFHPLMVASLQT